MIKGRRNVHNSPPFNNLSLCKRGLFHVMSLTVIYIRQIGIAAAGGKGAGLGTNPTDDKVHHVS